VESKIHDGKKSLQQMLLGKLDIHILKTETRSLSKQIKVLNIGSETQEAAGSTLKQIGIGNNFLNRTQKDSVSKRNNEQMGLHQTKELLHSKSNSH
jgi:hypothetical protein